MNIKANELRLGNLIRFNNFIEDERNVIVNARFFASMAGGRPFTEVEGSNNSELNNYYSGIVLTPEILEKCGFEYEDMGDDSPYERWVCKEYKELWVWNYNKTEEWLFCLGDGFEQGNYEYLHQLQNIYFALTGEELEVKL